MADAVETRVKREDRQPKVANRIVAFGHDSSRSSASDG
jgi:hypothetical protein